MQPETPTADSGADGTPRAQEPVVNTPIHDQIALHLGVRCPAPLPGSSARSR